MAKRLKPLAPLQPSWLHEVVVLLHWGLNCPGDMYLAKFTVDKVLDSHDEEEEGGASDPQHPSSKFQQQTTMQTHGQQ